MTVPRPPAAGGESAAETGGTSAASAAALLSQATATLAAAGVDAAGWDAERLLRHVLAWDRATLLTSQQAAVPEDAVRRFRELVERRSARVPLQHLTGSQAFWRHDFLVTRDVLIPRPETELLVETSLALVHDLPRPVIVDVGTGSGCIALSLASERAGARLFATELSARALAVARRNARRLGMEGRVSFQLGDLLAPVLFLAGKVDLVVSNPPYVDPNERDSLAPEVRDHEPAAALFASEPPPGVYERLARQALRVLRVGGRLLVEIGCGQESAVEDALTRAGLLPRQTYTDLGGITRAILALRER